MHLVPGLIGYLKPNACARRERNRRTAIQGDGVGWTISCRRKDQLSYRNHEKSRTKKQNSDNQLFHFKAFPFHFCLLDRVILSGAGRDKRRAQRSISSQKIPSGD
jgi:hypothetical protein